MKDAAAVPVWKGSGISVWAALADFGVSDRGFGTGRLDRALTHVSGLARPLLLAIRNSFRRRTRLALTLLTLAVGGLFFMAALNIRASMINTIDTLFGTKRFDLSLNLGGMFPLEAIERAMSRTPGVVRFEGWIVSDAALVAEGGDGGRATGSPHARGAGGGHAGGTARRFPVLGVQPEREMLMLDIGEGRDDAGIIFVGPSADAMRALGSKASARELAQAAGVPVIPGVNGAGLSDEALLAAAHQIGFPVLIKASAGVGGKGMRVVQAENEFLDAVQAARRESLSAFGSDHLILERYFTEIRHIEVQVLGDLYGHLIHLYERECSVQRRHQKIIEETPAPNVPTEVREQICAAAVSPAQEVGYASAGTVEFILTPENQFSLLEMNTRLQVENPVTEWVTGVDIAAWQIRIASGEPLTLPQTDIRQRGHALESRVYAEDPAHNFMPSTGTITYYARPQGPNIRVDDGIETGSVVSPYYDPMLAKIITWGADRADAIAQMRHALHETAVLGITTNIPYLLDILDHPAFRAGQTHTGFLGQHFPTWQATPLTDDQTLLAIAVAELLGGKFAPASGQPPTANGSATTPDPWNQSTGWRNVLKPS